jgi:hypothetical protein
MEEMPLHMKMVRERMRGRIIMTGLSLFGFVGCVGKKKIA